MIFGLLDLASVDGTVGPEEVSRLHELASGIGVSAQGCDIVIGQYNLERRNER